jgi:hypothetical protein
MSDTHALMPDDRLLAEYPTFFYHTVAPSSVAMRHMELVRLQYITVATTLLRLCPANRSRSLALTELEYSLMRAIQSLALTGELVDPRRDGGADHAS